jgi:hypothetical protein
MAQNESTDAITDAIDYLERRLTIAQLKKISLRLRAMISALNGANEGVPSLVDREKLHQSISECLQNGRKLRAGTIAEELNVDEHSVMTVLESSPDFEHQGRGWWALVDPGQGGYDDYATSLPERADKPPF